jgi:5-oxoprolinase (ATP-hydrolysing) subunit A
MMENPEVFDAIIKAIQVVDKGLSLVVQAGVKNLENNTNTTFLYEVFADRGYKGVEMLDRGEKGAVLNSADAIIEQYQSFLSEKSFKIDTICFHSDNLASIEALKQLKNA